MGLDGLGFDFQGLGLGIHEAWNLRAFSTFFSSGKGQQEFSVWGRDVARSRLKIRSRLEFSPQTPRVWGLGFKDHAKEAGNCYTYREREGCVMRAIEGQCKENGSVYSTKTLGNEMETRKATAPFRNPDLD